MGSEWLFRCWGAMRAGNLVILSAVTTVAVLIVSACCSSNAYAKTLSSPDDTGLALLRICQINKKDSSEFWQGYCFGYINSKVDRLDYSQIVVLDNKRLDYIKRFGPKNSDLPNMIYCVLQKADIHKNTKDDTGKDFASAEDILNYVVNHVVYTEACS